ncbi:MAG: ATP-binding cassette domain-containing protein [Pseudomonadota bacterium]
MTRVLEVRALTKGFTMHHLDTSMQAFTDVSFTLDGGKLLLLKGSNGAGKSTLLRTLYRSYLAQGGAILFHSSHGVIDLAGAADEDVTLLRRTEMGFVTQFLIARPRVSAEDLVAEPLRVAGYTVEDALAQARSWLDTFGVKQSLWPAYPTTFSGGEQQKVNLARALIQPRRLLLLDEPTASLDIQARAALIERLAELKARGTAMIGVFHHPGDVAALIDHELDLSQTQDPQKEPQDVAV